MYVVVAIVVCKMNIVGPKKRKARVRFWPNQFGKKETNKSKYVLPSVPAAVPNATQFSVAFDTLST